MTTAKSTKAKTPAVTKPIAKAKAAEVLFIQSKGERFRRCGREFNKNGEGIPLDSLTEEEIATLESEPQLSCQRTTAE